MMLRADRELSLIDFLIENFPDSNRTRLKKAIRVGAVTMKGSVLKHPEFILEKGSVIDFKKISGKTPSFEKPPFKIVFEDDEVIAAIKPPGILSSGTTTELTRSMFSMVLQYVKKITKGEKRAYTVHRLDREVSGLILFAKSESSQAFIKDHWQDTEKLYYALVEGQPQNSEGTISSWLKENSALKMYSVPREQEGAKWSITHYKVVKVYDGCSLLKISLETGRKNQIRVHLSELGHPIIGDRKYGADPLIKRQIRLFSYSLRFPHPKTGKNVQLEVPLPKTFLQIGNDHEVY